MGGGYVSRPDFGKTRMNPENPMSEFYSLLLQGLQNAKSFSLPGCWAEFRPDMTRKLYAEDMTECCRFTCTPKPGLAEVIRPENFQIGYYELDLTGNGSPASVRLFAPDQKQCIALCLLPPFGGVEIPLFPRSGSVLSLGLTAEDLVMIDEEPWKLTARMIRETQNKSWVRHPGCEAWLLRALAAAQKEYNRLHGDEE